ncbi:ABC transporter ATP-binding protein, partial [Arthrobacter sp. AL08]|nr:ABC transporter ATP-binding protein [Arthrobacter sp. AL08]
LAQDGTAVVIMSQRAEPFLHTADTWLVLTGGTVAATGTPAEIVAAGALEMAGVIRPRPLTVARPRAGVDYQSAVNGPTALELRDVSFTYRRTRRRGWFKSQP